MSWLQVSCFLQSQIFTAVAVKSGPVCKPAIHMGYAETAFPVVKYNFTYLYLLFPFQITWFQQEFYQALLYSPRLVVIVCCHMGSWLLIVTRQELTDTNPAVCYWHQNICGLSSRIGISSRVCSLTQVKKYQVCQKDFYVQFIQAGINKPHSQAIKTKEFFPTNYILGYEANPVQEWADVIICSCHTCSHH